MEVARAARYNRVCTLYEFLKLDIITLQVMMQEYRDYEIREGSGCGNMSPDEGHDLLFGFLVCLDYLLKRADVLPECRYLIPWDTDEDPQPAAYPINPAWKRKI